MHENVDYVYENLITDKNFVYIRLLTGDYKGTLYKYGKIKVTEGDEKAYLNFEYEVIESKHSKPSKLRKNAEFKAIIGALLIQIIIGATEDTIKNEEGIIDEFGTDNS